MLFRSDALYNCDSESIGSCMIQSAETGLFPGGPAPAVWLVPKAGQLHWWLSHRGVLTLAERAGYVVSAKPWFQADQFSYEAGTEERISHVPDLAAERTWDTLRGVYVIVRGKDDGIVRGIHVMTRTEIAQRRSKALDDNIWNSWPIEKIGRAHV